MGNSASISRKLYSLCAVVVLLVSCQFNGITGSGNVTTEKRNVEDNFTAIEAGKGLDIVLEQSPDAEVTVVADDNLQKHITTKHVCSSSCHQRKTHTSSPALRMEIPRISTAQLQ